MTNKTKLTVQLPDEAIDQITEIAKKLNITRTEAIRRALKTELFFVKEKEQGKRVLLKDEGSGTLQEVIML